MDIWNLLSKLERIFVGLIFLGVVSLVISQAMLTTEYGRNLLSQTDRLEGTTIQSLNSWGKKMQIAPPNLGVNNANWKKTGFVSLRLLDNPQGGKVKVLLNEREVAQFTEELLTIKVQDQDLLQIDTAECPSKIALEVAATSDNLLFPQKKMQISSNGNIIQLGRVQLKK